MSTSSPTRSPPRPSSHEPINPSSQQDSDSETPQKWTAVPARSPTETSDTVSSKWKGKGKEKNVHVEGDVGNGNAIELHYKDGERSEGEEEESDESYEQEPTAANSYPPQNDAELEERKVAENLKRWELLERQRRKSIRESISARAPTSIITDVARAASSMLGSGRERRPGPGPGSTVLEDLEPDQPNDMGGRDSVDTVGVTLNALPSPQADPLSAKSHRSISSVESTSSVATVTAANSNPDPFANPPHPITPDLPPEPAPQVDSPPQNPFFAPGELSPSPQSSFLSPPPRNTPRTRPSLQAQESSFVGSANPQSSKRIPPPIPLDIPMPPTPPPRITSPIEPQTPIPIALEEEELESDREGRWWTDWLCGCRETGARRSDSQAARTNPFE